jgi:hypothetical protein
MNLSLQEIYNTLQFLWDLHTLMISITLIVFIGFMYKEINNLEITPSSLNQLYVRNIDGKMLPCLMLFLLKIIFASIDKSLLFARSAEITG